MDVTLQSVNQQPLTAQLEQDLDLEAGKDRRVWVKFRSDHLKNEGDDGLREITAGQIVGFEQVSEDDSFSVSPATWQKNRLDVGEHIRALVRHGSVDPDDTDSSVRAYSGMIIAIVIDDGRRYAVVDMDIEGKLLGERIALMELDQNDRVLHRPKGDKLYWIHDYER